MGFGGLKVADVLDECNFMNEMVGSDPGWSSFEAECRLPQNGLFWQIS